MFRCILAPVDGTAFGEHALPVAAALARRCGATLRLAHVHVPLILPSGVETVTFRGDWTDVAKEQEREYLDGLAARVAAAYGVPVETALVDGPVADALARYGRECRADLVVMSCRGHFRFRRLWHHGVAEHVARHLPVPVLLARPRDGDEEPEMGADREIRHVLVPLDGTPYAEGILEHAVALARPFRARFTLLRVVRPQGGLGATLRGGAGDLHVPALDRQVGAARQYLGGIAERMRAAGLEVSIRAVASTDCAAAILEQARATPAYRAPPVDLIALEMHPHRALARIVAAHTADRVLHESPVPVLLFEPPVAAATRPATLAPSLSARA